MRTFNMSSMTFHNTFEIIYSVDPTVQGPLMPNKLSKTVIGNTFVHVHDWHVHSSTFCVKQDCPLDRCTISAGVAFRGLDPGSDRLDR